jgi:hypothetical protein
LMEMKTAVSQTEKKTTSLNLLYFFICLLHVLFVLSQAVYLTITLSSVPNQRVIGSE